MVIKEYFMDLKDVFLLIFNTIEMSQALSIGVFLAIINRKRKNSLLILGVFLIVSGLSSVCEIYDVFNVFVKSDIEELISFNFFALLPAILYVYVERVSILEKKKSSKYVLIPGIIEFAFNTIILFLPIKLAHTIENSLFYGLFEFLMIIYGLVLIWITFRKLRRHSKLIKDQYSSVERRDLKWIYYAVILIISMFLIMPVFAFIDAPIVEEAFGTLGSLALTYWISYNGLFQQVSMNLVNNNNVAVKMPSRSENLSAKKEKELERLESVFVKIESIIKEEKLFLNSDLTIVDVSDKVGEHSRLVSNAINSISSKTFNSYINRYRVEMAKEMLLSEESSRLNIEGIGFEVGFKSNSSFYTAFKKELKITPLQFVKMQKS